MARTVTLELGEFTLKALVSGHEKKAEDVPSELIRAIRYYLSDRDSARPEWACGTLLPGEAAEGGAAVELSVADSLWRSIEEEAGRQGVSTRQLVVHAALYFAADRDAGRLTERILDGIDATEQ